jgi:hypothetical protein
VQQVPTSRLFGSEPLLLFQVAAQLFSRGLVGTTVALDTMTEEIEF